METKKISVIDFVVYSLAAFGALALFGVISKAMAKKTDSTASGTGTGGGGPVAG